MRRRSLTKLCSGRGAKPSGLAPCKSCNGTGQIVREQRSGYSAFRQITTYGKCRGKDNIVKEACEECRGKGIIEKNEELVVSKPADADTGYKVRIEGKAKKGDDIPGDLPVVLNVERHPIFTR